MKKTSLLAKFLTEEVKVELAGVKTSDGFDLDYIVRSGTQNPDSSIGVYTPDADAYSTFGALFNPIIEEYHGYGQGSLHERNFNSSGLNIDNPDPAGTLVNSTRIRVGRNLEGFSFIPGISKKDRLEVESRVVEALSTLEGDLAGKYYPLSDMNEKIRKKMVEDHFLFKQGDRFLESAGANRDWPSGRGIFHSNNKQFLVWVNEEDHMRIISMQSGADIYWVFERLERAVEALDEKLGFAYSDRLGYLSSCPTNLGTAMRASVHIKLPKLSSQKEFKELCNVMGLSVRGVHGEHSEGDDGTYDISNKHRLGISEVEIANTLHKGVKTLIELENSLP